MYVYETNFKSVQRGKENHITKEEILTFLGINMIMSYYHLTAVKHYWSTSSDLKVLPIKKAMTRETFKFILGNLHVNNNHKMDKTSKKYKINKINNSKNTEIKTKLKALQTVSTIKGIIRGILFKFIQIEILFE